MPPKPAAPPVPSYKPVVVGIFGIPGSGKSHLIRATMRQLKGHGFAFYESRNAIDASCRGGLIGYSQLTEKEQKRCREKAIISIQKDCTGNNTTGLVAAHYMFWPQREISGHTIITDADLDTYTHILYLDPPSETIMRYRGMAKEGRMPASLAHLGRWRKAEKEELRRLCLSREILFMVLTPPLLASNKLPSILRGFQRHSEEHNTNVALKCLDNILSTVPGKLEEVTLLDSDTALTPCDGESLFWSLVCKERQRMEMFSSLIKFLEARHGFSYFTLRQTMLIHEEALEHHRMDVLSSQIASRIRLYPELKDFLKHFARKRNIKLIVLTHGPRQVWEKVLKREGLADNVGLVGGGFLEDGIVMTSELRGALVRHLRETHHARVRAFGDSLQNLEMLSQADEALIIIGTQQKRAGAVNKEFQQALARMNHRKVIVPSYDQNQFDENQVPVTRLFVE
ncbi:hypothetical protein N7492_002553 [Penicillium capsulatum]|uniref:Uncharacterized protein n=1 Tax=Penicillium capsulatum TaxID=69766 RepID=A0A9W9IJK6_9EURO|nr:hypothetical protein N7492_002553 [Penicillium capsulatum]KAJ6122843.1 hypothetical protein N7512_005308 [Penicillium capsulatum]